MSRIIDKPNKIKAKLIVEVEADFYDNESSEETLRYCVEQDLEDAGFNVIDVSVMKWRFQRGICMGKKFNYKNYKTNICYDSDDNIYFGSLIGIRDNISFHGKTINEAIKRFHEVTNDYIVYINK